MRIIRQTESLPPEARGAVVALGNFDGVHRGHQAVIAQAAAMARKLGATLGVTTFEPHPRTLFLPQEPPFRLTPFRTKAQLLAGLGVEYLYVLRFNAAFAQLTAQEFISDILVRGYGVRHVVVGYDFVFGHKRSGNVDLIRAMAGEGGFGVTVVEPVTEPEELVFSSTRTRLHLAGGDPRAATHVLGHPWTIEGRVVQGFQRGRTIGVPTANIDLGQHLCPAFGVYAVKARTKDGQAFQGVANIGRRPTVDGARELLEVHLFDANLDLYGRRLCVDLIDFIRPERKFESFDALKDQIMKDIAAARKTLES